MKVGIRQKQIVSSSHWCGATILSEDVILTAAHCVHKHNPASYILRIGDYDNTVILFVKLSFFNNYPI